MNYPKDVILKNSNHILLKPYAEEYQDRLRRFYLNIPDTERWCIPYDMMKAEMQCQWSDHSGKECLYSIIAVHNEEIIGHGNLHEGSEGPYAKHVGRLYVKIAPQFRGQRLGTWMILDLIKLAMERELRDLRIDLLLDVDATAIDALSKLDFFKRAVLEAYAIDPDGNRHDVVIMTKRLHKEFGDY